MAEDPRPYISLRDDDPIWSHKLPAVEGWSRCVSIRCSEAGEAFTVRAQWARGKTKFRNGIGFSREALEALRKLIDKALEETK